MGLDVRDRFAAGRGYLGAATLGLPADVTVAALRRDVETYAIGTVDVMAYTASVEAARGTPPPCWASYRPASPSARRPRCSSGSRRPRRRREPRWCASRVTSRRWSGRSWPAATCGCGRCRSPSSPEPWARTPGWWRTRWCPRAPASRRRRRRLGGRARTGRGCSSTSPRPPAGCPLRTSTPTWLSATRTSGSARRAAARSPRSPSAPWRSYGRYGGLVLRRDPWPSCYGPGRPRRRRQPVRRLAGLARLGRRRGRARVRGVAGRCRGARPRRRPRERVPGASALDRPTARSCPGPTWRARTSPHSRPPGSSRPVVPAGRACPSTSGTTRRTSTSRRGRWVDEAASAYLLSGFLNMAYLASHAMFRFLPGRSLVANATTVVHMVGPVSR